MIVKPIFCDNPYVIYNPQCKYVYANSEYARIGHTTNLVRTWFDDHTIPYKMLYKCAHMLTDRLRKDLDYSIFDDYYILTQDGEQVPLFIAVPCGKCKCCCETKVVSLAQQIEFESQLYDYPPLWVTLTYNNENLPSDGQINYEDFKKFLKRLRINLERRFNYTVKLKYVSVGEYGSTYGRPHFHALIFGIDCANIANDYKQGNPERWIKEFIQYNWMINPSLSFDDFQKYIRGNGIDLSDPATGNTIPYIIGHTDVKYAQDGNVSYYLSKYVVKQRLRVHKSINLGCSFAEGLLSQINPNNVVVSYLNKFQFKIKQCNLTRYFINKFFPSGATQVKVEVRRCLSTIYNLLNNLKYAYHHLSHLINNYRLDLHNYATQIHNKYEWFPQIVEYNSDVVRSGIACGFSAQNIVDSLHGQLISSISTLNLYHDDNNTSIVNPKRESFFASLSKLCPIDNTERMYKLHNRPCKVNLNYDNQ